MVWAVAYFSGICSLIHSPFLPLSSPSKSSISFFFPFLSFFSHLPFPVSQEIGGERAIVPRFDLLYVNINKFAKLLCEQDDTCATNDPGDYVDDTPQQSQSKTGCPSGKDSCPGSPGVDPISNYMDYSTDAWYVASFFFSLSYSFVSVFLLLILTVLRPGLLHMYYLILRRNLISPHLIQRGEGG